MSKRYEAEDATGRRVWLEGGMEVHESPGGGFRVCWNPASYREDAAWAPGEFPGVTEAFAAGRVAKDVSESLGS